MWKKGEFVLEEGVAGIDVCYILFLAEKSLSSAVAVCVFGCFSLVKNVLL